jgi:carboxymethylenebutenolidase
MRLSLPIALGGLLLAAATVPLAAQQVASIDYADRMHAVHEHDAPIPSGAVQPPRADVVSDTVTYMALDGKPVQGFRSRPKNARKDAPALIVVHEWWGLNDNIRAATERLAGEGYVALAVDLYGTVAPNADSAARLYRHVMENVPAGRANLAVAIDYLRAQGAKKVGSIGWCFGGHWSLQAGLVGGDKVQAVVMYYGQPITDPAVLQQLRAPLLGLFGSQDTGIPVDSVKAMAAALDKLGRTETMLFFDAGHGFANPSGKNYNAVAAEAAWKRTTAFPRRSGGRAHRGLPAISAAAQDQRWPTSAPPVSTHRSPSGSLPPARRAGQARAAPPAASVESRSPPPVAACPADA